MGQNAAIPIADTALAVMFIAPLNLPGIKIMKLLWDAIGTEFGGRHELYEYNYAGNHEDIRIHAMWNARASGTLDGMIALADECLAEYDENGWVGSTWLDPDDVAYGGVNKGARAAE